MQLILRASGVVLAQAGGLDRSIDYWAVMTSGSPVVVAVLVILMLSSIVSWAIIVRKALHLRSAQRQTAKFLGVFWQAKRLDALYQEAEGFPLSPVAQV